MLDTNPSPTNLPPEVTPNPPAKARYRRWLFIGGLVAAALLTALAWHALMQRPPTRSIQTANLTPAPSASSIPTPVKVSAGKTPALPLVLPPGFVAHIFADGLIIARDLALSPGGTLLVSNPKAGTVTALPDANHDGVADSQKVVVSGGTQSHGLAFHANQLFVAELGQLNRYHWNEASQSATFDKTILTLPTDSGHTSRTLSIAADGTVYVTIGSTCNVCREANAQHATVLVTDINGTNPHTYASGLRNAAFSAVHPTTGELWATENGRDNLGDNLPPDEINLVRAGKNYGWPLCYGARLHDTNFDKNTYVADPCAATEPPIFEVPAHNAPLGLIFIKSPQFAAGQQGDLLVAYHGSWNRSIPDGYKVVRLHLKGNTITGSEDFMTGFIQDRTVGGRPVDVTFDALGNLYVSDDLAGAVYIVQRPK